MAFTKNNKADSNNKFQKIGALWKKQSQSDPSIIYLSGNVEIDGQKIPITVMKNKFKGLPGGNENAPDYTISSPVDGPQQSSQSFRKPAPAKAANGKTPFRKPAPKQEFDSNDEPQEPDNTPEADF